MTDETTTYDAIVVGSGISGGWAAKELTENGLKTLLLERGKPVEHGKDYIGEHIEPWQLPFRGKGDRKLYDKDHPIQQQCYAFGEDTRHFFVNDRQHPYTQSEPFSWIRGYHLGGKSIMWARQCYRWSDLDFGANARDGHGVDWPIRYADIAPWYDYVESFAGISGQAEGLPQLPDGKFLPPMEMNCVETAARARIAQAFPDRVLTMGRIAVLTQAHLGRAACHHCGPCHRGCSTSSYFCSLSSTLPAARATGNLTTRTFSIVHSVMYDPKSGRASGVRVIDAVTKDALEFRARLVFVCASTLGTAQILLNSTSTRFPDGIANSSGALGRYLMDHTFQAGANALMPGYEAMESKGYRPTGVYMARFRNVDSEHPDFLRGYGIQAGAGRDSWDRGFRGPGLGVDLKRRLRQPGPWRMGMGGFGECLPRYDNYVDLDPDETDAWGIPVLRVHCTFGDNEAAMRKDMQKTAAEMLEAAGGTEIETYDNEVPPGLCIHEMGTCRMGRDPETSVLNGWNQAHEVPNLFVTDGSSMASCAWQNPSITFMALTARACHHAVEEMKNGRL
jgi:glucoside 3-dehydrogenase (cytochrome c) catalytic subunit